MATGIGQVGGYIHPYNYSLDAVGSSSNEQFPFWQPYDINTDSTASRDLALAVALAGSPRFFRMIFTPIDLLIDRQECMEYGARSTEHGLGVVIWLSAWYLALCCFHVDPRRHCILKERASRFFSRLLTLAIGKVEASLTHKW